MKRVRTVNPTETIVIDHIGDSPPENPQKGMIQIKNNELKYQDGTSWKEVSDKSILSYLFYFNKSVNWG